MGNQRIFSYRIRVACMIFALAALASAGLARAEATDPVPPAATQPTPAIQSADLASRKLVTNIWVDTDIRQVVQDISSQTDTVILCEPSVQGLVSMSVKDMGLEECLERVCASGGYSYMQVKDYYVLGKADPGGSLFQQMADPLRVRLSSVGADQVRALLHASLVPYVTFDKPSGALLVTAPEPTRSRILDAIRAIDQPSPQVAIEAVVFELSQEGSKQLGLDWQFEKTHIALGGHALIGTFTYDADSDVGTFVDMTLRAIVESRKGQVLANPRILVMHNTEAEIFVGQEKYFTLLSGQASNPYYTLQSIKSGVTLRVLPRIGKEGRITLELEPEVSDVVADATRTGGVTVLPGGTFEPLPVVTRRHARTIVNVNDGQTLLIGGLLLEQNREVVDKVPLAGDIPGLGAAFRNVRKQKQQEEVVILITAHVQDSARPRPEDLASRLEQLYVSPMDAIAACAKGVAP
jgi:type II secretory pathway component GspD/PulD (secretin)